MNNKTLTLKKAKELASFIKELKGEQIVLVNTVAPMQTDSGIYINEETQKAEQAKLNKYGMLVARSNGDIVKEGELVALSNHPVFNLTRVITTEEFLDNLKPEVVKHFQEKTGRFKTMSKEELSTYYKKYVVIVLHPNDIVCTLN